MAHTPETDVQVITDPTAIDELTTRAVAEIYPSREEFVGALESGQRLRAYMGIDPTAPDMHVGHMSQLLKLRRLQELGHEVILLIGDFTAMIGDPSDKSASRVQMTRDEVLENAQGYQEQASKILDFEDPNNPIQLRYNHEWLGAMGFAEVLGLASEFTVQQMLARKTFRDRIDADKPLHIHEMMYPLMQGYDSVAMGVDIEVGGSDQTFNMLVGTDLVKRMLGKQKYIIAGELLADPSGKKIGKTEGNMITLNDAPGDMYHRVMMWGDDITPHALELCTAMPMAEVRAIEEQLRDGTLTGLAAKALLARTIVDDLHSPEAAQQAEIDYRQLTSQQEESDTELFDRLTVASGEGIIAILTVAGFAESNSQARRLLEGGAVRINGETVSMDWVAQQSANEAVLQVGKKKRENHRVLRFEESGS